jgi:transcriptional regulator with XRE-family HTH domain
MEQNFRAILGKKAKELRKQVKKSQFEVAEALGFPRSDISGFESRGERITTVERIEVLFNYYGYTILEPSEVSSPFLLPSV